jgi:TonB family protein
MAMTRIPTAPPPPRRDPTPPPDPALDVPSLLVELEGERDRLLRRQAVLISVIVHMVFIASIPLWVKIWPKSVPLMAPSVADLMRDRNLVFTEGPRDNQQVSKRPDTNVLSDKDRIASSRRPTIDRKTLDELRSAAPPGPPGAPGLPSPQPPQQASAGPAPTAPPGPAQQSPSQTARLEGPPTLAGSGRGVFSSSSAPGSTLEQATRAAAAGRGAGGAAGDYGFGGHSSGPVASNMEILSDTLGVDFGPYLERVLQSVRTNWYAVIPESAYPPLRKKGEVTIQFAILPDGRVAGLHFENGSGDIPLDRAAYAGISASNPFPPLPPEFKGPYLALRIRFYYNPDRNDLR